MVIKTLSAGIIVVWRKLDDCRFLVLRAYHYWDFPKGEVEAGEDPFNAACRELQEETGLTRLDFPWGQVYRETEPYGRGKVARYYVAESTTAEVRFAVNPELGRPEHHEFRWIGYDEASRLLVPRVRTVFQWAYDMVVCK